jgi:hypothetical protein
MSRLARLRMSLVATAVMAAQLVPIAATIASTGGGDFPLLR